MKKAQARFRKQMKDLGLEDEKKASAASAAKVERLPSYIEEKAPVPKPWNPVKHLGGDFFITYNGARRQGKTWMTRYNLWAQRHWFRCGEVFSNSPMNGFWQKHFPEWKVISGWRPGTMLAIMQEQAEVASLYQRFPDRINPYRVVVLEDVCNDLQHDPVLEDLATYGRHLYLSVHVITQHPQKLPPVVRSNTDVVVIFPLHSRSALECLADDYLSNLDKKAAASLLTEYAWKKPKVSQALVIALSAGNRLSEKTFFCQAPDPGPFLIGSKEYWDGLSTIPDEEEIAKWEAGEESDKDDESSDNSLPTLEEPDERAASKAETQ